MPKIPKSDATRRRTNKAAGVAKLEVPTDLEHVPERWRVLPEARPRPFVWFGFEGKERIELDRTGLWHECTADWWAEVVRSSMAKEFVGVDWHGLLRVAVLIDDYWHGGEPSLMTEIRQQQAAYGLTPLDRRKLQWEVQRVTDKETRRSSSQAAHPAAAKSKPRDPRLRVVQGGGA